MKDKFEVEINEKWCSGCGLCVDICPKDVFEFDIKKNVARVRRPDDCIGCNICEERCPDLAIEVKRKEDEDREETED